MAKLTEENKLLRVPRAESDGLSDKCLSCSAYSELIASLSSQKEQLASEFSAKIISLQDRLDLLCKELDSLKAKNKVLNEEIIQKIENECILNCRIDELQSKKQNLMAHIKNTLDTAKGFEFLENTVASLSLTLINKDDKDLTPKQKQMVKDLFEESQIKVINNYKERARLLESDNLKAYEIAKKQTEDNAVLLKIARKYALAVKE